MKKKLIALLSIWSFMHFILFLNGGSLFTSTGDVLWGTHDCLGVKGICQYDITEFVLFVGGAWLIFVLYYYLKHDK